MRASRKWSRPRPWAWNRTWRRAPRAGGSCTTCDPRRPASPGSPMRTGSEDGPQAEHLRGSKEIRTEKADRRTGLWDHQVRSRIPKLLAARTGGRPIRTLPDFQATPQTVRFRATAGRAGGFRTTTSARLLGAGNPPSAACARLENGRIPNCIWGRGSLGSIWRQKVCRQLQLPWRQVRTRGTRQDPPRSR